MNSFGALLTLPASTSMLPPQPIPILKKPSFLYLFMVFSCLGKPIPTSSMSGFSSFISAIISLSSSGLKYPVCVPTIFMFGYFCSRFCFASSAYPGLLPQK